ncbi:MAG: glycerate dehydrogenase [Candidatus Endobugula sp.]|jgi:glycerate dehydrogenase
MKPKIVFLDRATIPSHIGFKPLRVDHEWTNYELTSPSQLIGHASDADIVITNKVVLGADVIKQLPTLKHIAVIATGYNNIDIGACESNGISVSNTPDYSVTSVPEHTLALMLALRRHLFAYQANVREGAWHRSPYFHAYVGQTFDLKGARLGIIGGGSLGKATAALAQAIGMEVVFAERKGSKNGQRDAYIPFDELIRTSDVISLHCPLSAATANIISMDELKLMKPHALLINTARGGLVNERDLAQALKDQLIAGAGFDVASMEPLAEDNPLNDIFNLPNFILTPHVAWSSDSALQCQADMVIDNIGHFLQNKPLHRVV